MSVYNNQVANETTFNNGLASKMVDNVFAGVQTLEKDGLTRIANLQALLLKLLSVIGTTEIAANPNDYENQNYITSEDDRKAAISKLDAKLKEFSDALFVIQNPSFTRIADAVLENNGTIALNNKAGLQRVFAQGSAAAVTMSTTPFGAIPDCLDNTTIEFIGLDDINTVVIPYADIDGGCLIQGEIAHGKGRVTRLCWDSSRKRFFHLGGN